MREGIVNSTCLVMHRVGGASGLCRSLPCAIDQARLRIEVLKRVSGIVQIWLTKDGYGTPQDDWSKGDICLAAYRVRTYSLILPNCKNWRHPVRSFRFSDQTESILPPVWATSQELAPIPSSMKVELACSSLPGMLE